MIASLRKRFIIIAMCSVLAVLAVIIGAINIGGYTKTAAKADEMLTYLSANGGAFPSQGRDEKGSNLSQTMPIPPDRTHKITGGISAEAPFDTRFFSVLINARGEISSANLGNIAAVAKEQATEYAGEIYASGSQKGYVGDYRYLSRETENGTLIIFLDNSRELTACRSFLITSLLASLLGSMAFFVLVLLLSKRVMQPVTESYEKQKRFITDAGHELKTPLTVIDANTEVIELESGETQWTKSIRNQVSRLSSLTQSLVELSRMGEGGKIAAFTEFSMSDAVEESALPFLAPAQTKGKNIKTEIEPQLSYKGDEKALRQLVGILLDNAIKYSVGTDILLSLKKQGKSIVLICKNEAEGLEKRSYPELFDRFYRVDSSRSSQVSGYGIGLSLAQAIVQTHKGKISSKSEDGISLAIIVSL